MRARLLAFLAALLALALAPLAHAQSCSAILAGPATWTGIVNTYYPGSGTAVAGSTSIGVGAIDGRGAATPIADGDLLLIVQIQDASISTSNSPAYGGSITGGGHTALNSSGLYEYAVAAGPVSAGSVPLRAPLVNTYRTANANSTDGQKRFQVIRVPQASSATLSGNLTAPPWNGSTGGIVAIDVAGNLNWGGRTIDVSGRGFRGGGGQVSNADSTGAPANNINDYVSNQGGGTLGTAGMGSVPNGAKGEGIAGTPIIVFTPTTPDNNGAGTITNTGGTDGTSGGYPGGSFARGAPGNAGGGGTDGNLPANDQNTGGAGGGNYGQGGMGGFGWTPGIPPGWDGGGIGGAPVPGSASRLFFGGGGGAGTTNNQTGTPGIGAASSGAAGGGLIFVRAGSTTGTATLNARGTHANNTVTNDASGGGGAGGSVLVFVDNGGAPIGATINIQGGNGGTNTGGGSPHGPGGGGSGGFALLSGTATVNAAGGANGTTAGSATSTPDYGSTSSVGGFEIVTLTASQIPGAGGQGVCFPQLTVTKSTSTPFVAAGGTATYAITVTNLAGRSSAQSVSISDALPHPNITYASTSSVTLGGGATRPTATNPTAGSNTPAWGSFTIPGGGSVTITFVADVAGSVPTGTYQNPANVTYLDPTRTASQTVTPGGTYTAGGTVGGSNYAPASTTNEDVTVATAPTLAKSFNPTAITVGAPSVMTVTIGNPSAVALTNVGLVDNYPAGLVNTASPNASTTCSGAVISASPSGTSFTLSGGSIPAGGSCTVTVNVTMTAPGPYTNTLPAGALTNTQNLSNVTAASATLYTNVRVVKSFSPTAVSPNSDATLALDLVNDNTIAVSLANPGLTDNFPPGLVATGGPVTVTGAGCSGFAPATVTAGAASLVLTAGTIPASSTCRVSLAVRSAANGIYANSTSGVTTTAGTTGPVSNTANLGVGVINASKSFSPATIVSGGTSTVTITLDNPTGVAQAGGAFDDTLTGMSIAGNQNTGGTCGLVQALANGQTALSFSGINIPPGSCTVTFTVTSSSVGTQTNTTGGVITSTLARGPASNTAQLNVIDRPTIAKAFAPATINPGGTSTLTFTITNPGPVALSGMSFTDTYPANVVNATPLTVGGSCTGVTHTAAAGGNTFNVTAGNLPVASSCTITVLVTSSTVGSYNNTTSGVTTTQTAAAGAGAPSNTATLSVANPPTIAKAFGTSPISQGGTSVVTFTLTNANTIALANVRFSDTLTGMSLANGTIGGTCAGTTAAPALAAGSTSLNFTIPSVAASSSCTVTVTVTSSTSGSWPNTTTGATSTQTPTAGAPSNTATLVVLSPPQLAKGFIPAAIQAVSGTTSIRFTLTNPNATALTNVAWSDALVNMQLGTAPNVVETCAGVVTSGGIAAGSTNINFTVPTLNAGETCTITVSPVVSNTASPAAGHANTTSTVSSTQTSVNPGAAATANLLVYAPPQITKSFSPASVVTNATSVITFTVTNPNPVALNGIAFTDDLPTNLSNNAAQTFVGGARGTCTTAIPQSKVAGVVDPINFNNISLAPGASCTVMMDVFSATAGFYTNTVTNITSNQTPNAVTGGNDTLTVGARMLLTETFTPPSIVVGATSTMRFTVNNNNAGNNQQNIDLSATLPAGLQAVGGAATFVNVAGTCTFAGAPPVIAPGATSIVLTNFIVDMDVGDVCAIDIAVTATAAADYDVTVTAPPAGNPTSIDNATATATLIAYASPTIAKAFAPATIAAGGASTVTLTLGNGHPTRALTNAAFTDTLTNMSVAGAQAVGGTCAGTTPSNLAAAATNLSFSGITIPAGGSCSVTFTVTSTNVGANNNTTSGVTTTQTPAAGAASNTATLTVGGVNVTKAFDVASRPVGVPARLTITLSSTQPVDWTGLAFTDTLPANMEVANPANATTSCGAGAVTAAAGGNTVALSGGTMPNGASPCTVAVDVVSNVAGNYTNAAANFSGGSPGMNFSGASASLQYYGNATLTKAFVPSTIGAAGTSVLTFTLTNGAGNPAQSGLGFTDALPAGVVVAGTPGITTNCPTGAAFAPPVFTVTAPAGSGSVAVSGASITSGVASCQVRVNVTASAVGSYPNTSANISALAGGLTAGGVNATLAVVGTTLTKSFTPAAVAANTAAQLRFLIANGAGNPAQTGLAFTDTLPTNVVVANPPAASHTCAAGTFAPTAGAGTVTFSGGTLNAGTASCEVLVNVVSAVPGSYTNAAANVSGTPASMDKSGVNATLTVLAPPTASKAFGAANIASGATTSLTLTFNNANTLAVTGLAFTDTFPTTPGAMTLANTTTSNTCGGTLTDVGGAALNAGDTGIQLTGGTIPASGSCTVTVNVTAGVAGSYTNTLAGGTITTTNAGAVAAATSASLTVLAAPTITKAFNGPIGVGGTATLTFQVANPNAATALTGVAFSDTFPVAPAAMVVAATPAASTSGCGTPTFAPVAGAASVAFSGGTIAAGATCTVTVNVTAPTAGTYNNTSGAVTASGPIALTGGTAAASLTVVQAALTKAFAPTTIAGGGTSTLTFTIANGAGNPAQSGMAFTDTLPAGVSIAGTPNLQTDCPAGDNAFGAPGFTATAAAGTGSIAVSGVPLNAGAASCRIRVDVTAALGGSYTNGAGNVSGLARLTNSVTAQTLTVTAVPPTVAKSFAPATISAGAASTLTITLTNANTTVADLSAALVDNLPAGVVVANPANAATTCGGSGAVTANPGGTSVTLAATRDIPAGAGTTPGSCTVSVDVTSAIGGTHANTIAAGALQTSNGNNTAAANANLTVNTVAPTVAKAFAPATIAAGATSTLTITLTNANNAAADLGAALTDNLPAGVTVANPPNAATTCAGSGAVAAAAGGSSVTLPDTRDIPGASGGAAGSCTVTVDVTASLGGAHTNTIAAGALQTSNGNNAAAANATLTVNAVSPTVAKAFLPATVNAGVASTLTITLTNANTSAATLTAPLTDNLPSGLVVAATPNASTTCAGAGAFAPAAGATAVTLPAGRVIPAGTGSTPGTCTITVDVSASLGGAYNNSIAAGALQTSVGNSGVAANATLTVNALAPSIAIAFSPNTIAADGTSTLTFTLSNPNTFALSAGAFTDTLSQMSIAASAAAGGTCAGASGNSFTAGQTALSFSGIAVPAGSGSTPGTCTVTVVVTSDVFGARTNQTSSGLSSAEAPTGAVSNVATLTVTAAPATITKQFSPASIVVGGTSTVTFLLGNANGASLTGAAFTDTLANMSIASTAAAGGTCTGASGNSFTAGQTALSFSGITLAPNATCTVTVVVTSATIGTHPNQASGVSTNEAATGSASASVNLTVTAAAPTIAKSFTPATISVGQTSTLLVTISNPNTGPITVTSVTDTFPTSPGSGMTRAATPNASTTCAGGAVSSTAGSVTLTGGTVPASGSCTFQIDVTTANAGSFANTIPAGALTTNAGSNAGAANATLTVTATPPTIAKAFAPATIQSGQVSTLTITLSNPNNFAVNVTSVTDNFPASPGTGIARAATPNASTTCAGGTVSSTATSVTLTGGAIPANASCTLQIDVTAPTAGSYVNTIPAGALTSDAGANVGAATATLTVTPLANVSISKSGPATIPTGTGITYTLTISNAGPDPADGTTFSDNVPTEVTGVGASCGATAGGAACGAVNVAGNAVTGTIPTLPAGGSLAITITGTARGLGFITNTATVATPSGTPDPTPANNTSSVTTEILAPDLTITKTHPGNFTVGANGTYTITVHNSAGSLSTTGTITVTDTLPTGLTYVSASGTGWSCGHASGTVTCTTSSSIAAGASASPISLTVAVGPTASPAVTNFASVSGGGEPVAVNNNNQASDYTLVVTPAANTFAPDNARTTGPGTTVFYAHTFTAGSAGSVAFSTSAVFSPAVPGWTQLLYRDTDCSGALNGAEGASQLSGAVAVAAGESICIIVVDNVPAAAPFNARATITVTSTFNGSQTISRTDVTTVSSAAGAGLALTKTVRNVTQGGAAGTAGTARPNDVLEYTVAYSNNGGGPITQIVINDATPAFTTFESAACGPLPAGISACTVTTQPSVGGTGGVVWTLTGSLASGNSGYVTYQVRVAP